LASTGTFIAFKLTKIVSVHIKNQEVTTLIPTQKTKIVLLTIMIYLEKC